MKSVKSASSIIVILFLSVAIVAGFFYFKASKRLSAEIPAIKPGVSGDMVPVVHTAPAVPSGHAVFSDYTERSGIDFLHHQAEDVINSLPQVIGSGVCLFDYDNDGNMDVYLVNGSGYTYYYGEKPWWHKAPSNALYHNEGNGRFTNVTKQAGVGYTGWGMGCAAADYDNDGHRDLYVTYYGKNVLYKNNGNGTFTDVTDTAGVGGNKEKWSTSSAWVDYDNDGWLDLYVVNYVKFDKYMNPGEFNSAYQMPTALLMNSKIYTGSANILFHNNKDGTFTDVTKKAGVEDSAGKGLGVVFSDFNNDGRPDLYVVNDGARNILFRNNGDGTFTDIGGEAGVDTPLSGMGVAAGDYDNDGDFDIFSTYPASETNILYRNEGSQGREGRLAFKDVTVASGLGEDAGIGYFGWGAEMFDYDNDGHPDLFVANGNPNPDFDNPRTTVGQRNQLFRNDGNGIFRDVSDSAGDGLKIIRSSRGAAFGDIDNDGDIDIVINNNNNYASVLRNDGGNSGNFLTIRLKGTKSNRDGIGARVTVTAGSLVMLQEVRSGSGYLSQSDLRLHFGMNEERKADRIVIQWPSGFTQTFKDVAANRLITITEGEERIEERVNVIPAKHVPAGFKRGAGIQSKGWSLDSQSRGNDEANAVSPKERAMLLALSDSRPSQRIEAMRLLRETSNEALIDKAIEPVMMSLSHRDRDVRGAAADLLCKFLKDEQTILRTTMHRKRLAVVPLVKALADPEPGVRGSAAKALGYSESYRAVIPVTQMLKDPDQGVRREAALALGWLKDKRGIEPLLDRLRDHNEVPSVRSGALLSLIRLESDATVAPLTEQLQGEDKRERLAALETFQSALKEDETVLLNRKLLIQPLIALSEDSDVRVKIGTIKTLSLIKDSVVIPPLIHALSDESKEVRMTVVTALGELRDKKAVEAMVSVLNNNNEDEEVRLSALKSPAFIIDKETASLMLQITADPAEAMEIRLSALRRVVDSNIVFWDRNAAKFLENDEPEIRRKAVQGVGRLHDAQSADLLLRCLRSDKDNSVRSEALIALGSYKERKVVDALIGIIRSSSEEKGMRQGALASLVRIGDERAVIHIQGIARNNRDELRGDAEEALKRFRQ
ncbi:MAG: VCBS repeat-containing protein [Nitrospirae bacterium]|nr:VCBS repeat-containing protein [Nitrospirota bacterium]